MRIPYFFREAEKDQEYISLLFKENPKISILLPSVEKTLFLYHNFRQFHLNQYGEVPNKKAIKWFNFKCYIKHVIFKNLIDASFQLFALSASVLFIYLIYKITILKLG